MIFNDRLDTILSQFASDIHGLPSFDEYAQKFRVAKINESKQSIISTAKTKLQSLHDQLAKEITGLNDQIAKIKAPNLNSTDPMIKVYGAIEYNNALLIIQNKPKNIGTILKDAANQGRMEFVFEVANGILKSEATENYKRVVSFVLDAILEQTGVTKIEAQKQELELLFVETKDYLELVKSDPEKFEANVSTKARVVRAMYENGQFEGESIFLKRV